MSPRRIASDEFIVWAESLSGMLTSLRTSYGTIEEMLEHPDWDDSRTEYLLQLVQCLHSDLALLDEEMNEHVEAKNRKGL